ncbi:putative 3-hydroxyisobutyryl-CoA hydrolase [Helianthus annuus]|uniref:3-hydroxyisobutyryl-CoA hydrolase n=1 Tax=Helianthus annuus TaxID=4232 RepID=A0A9K3JKD8_HELAN|nr:3-hydroxyisobutyryl-CoA hydrolase-like protein 1, mitochondrial [Helianthus annuus]KAF5816729.1 putative 3-hydroxyisobutyryl-CoA hydrolase [Helianthus annuus]KAJ0603302.1 putative 3-hydroxyisobutyryl-CoA hydrolase [Helianthus annuus]KAJ0609996.1 putative 3-hydroxyisobutyryl-CoA hydrolase [Helianthus annuus]KAJ0775783.1 putative 3-hydroxyisobutyryl-CoA hydrolase [Helianthus annuus]KAJ0945981.1 putative 3-hydroxyisobutyryl-CoA hydrolase [Helianthus annuus]
MLSFTRKGCYVPRFFDIRRRRSFSNNTLSDSSVLVEGNGSSRTVILNRPSVLNALNTPMLNKLHKLYKSWEDNPNIAFVVMKGSGRAFCSGGDIVSFYDMIRKGNIEECKEFFSTLYEFIYFLSTYKKPQVAVLDGVTMGGGAGVAIPETFRVATDKTVFATPETLVGLHPDAGASFHLSRLPGYLGEFLGLTGSKLNGAEMIACGLATHYSHSQNVLAIEESLNNLITNDPCVIESCIHNLSDLNHLDKNSVFRRMKTINKCFSLDTVEEIIEALEREAAKTHDPWCYSMLKNLKNASPLSLKVSLRSIREGRFQTLDQCLIREYRLTSRVVSCQISSDFCEGVRARMVDKDFAPKWNPPSLEHISYDMVDEYFSPLGAFESELELSTRKPEPFHEQIRI